MAKKKKTTTKKKAKRKKAKRTTKKRSSTKRKKGGVSDAVMTLAKMAGADTCKLCDRSFRTLEELEEHVYKEHGGITRAEYLKYFPSATKGVGVVAQDVLSMDELYRGMLHAAKYGNWPEWMDASKRVDLTAANSSVMRAFASVIIDSHQERVLGILRYLTIGLRREFTMEHAMNGPPGEVEAQVNRGLRLVKDSMKAMHQMADLLKKTEAFGKEEPKNRLLIAAQLESGTGPSVEQEEHSQQNRFQHQVTALTSELHGLMQSFMSDGSEHGNEPPSQVVDVEVEEVKTGSNGSGG